MDLPEFLYHETGDQNLSRIRREGLIVRKGVEHAKQLATCASRHPYWITYMLHRNKQLRYLPSNHHERPAWFGGALVVIATPGLPKGTFEYASEVLFRSSVTDDREDWTDPLLREYWYVLKDIPASHVFTVKVLDWHERHLR